MNFGVCAGISSNIGIIRYYSKTKKPQFSSVSLKEFLKSTKPRRDLVGGGPAELLWISNCEISLRNPTSEVKPKIPTQVDKHDKSLCQIRGMV
ncbi:hypothetical protein CEXT_732801 [Caerostris extrusa]|uniref:Uncharacterized protein n=1 Tax=Caerostris extrusa TaxID=172846 RepID=A0AAV4QZG6_CAEEX|nr:hypothetical protein CEXT_732801 [Caerostris extrusa]